MSVVRFTGHPLADVGVATLCALRGKNTPNALTLGDLDKVADELGAYYFSGLMTSYLSCVFMNSEYVQPAKGKGKEKKRADYEERVLRAHRWRGDEGTGTHFQSPIHRGTCCDRTAESAISAFRLFMGPAAPSVLEKYLPSYRTCPLIA